jgi:hypothetical protein
VVEKFYHAYYLKAVPRDYGRKTEMSDVKRVTSSLKGMMVAVKKEIDAAEAEVAAAQDETIMAVGMTRAMVRGVRDEVAELRALLGGATNNPPTED